MSGKVLHSSTTTSLTKEDVEALREEVIKWRDESFNQWPEAIPFTTTASHLIAALHTMIGEIWND